MVQKVFVNTFLSLLTFLINTKKLESKIALQAQVFCRKIAAILYVG